MGDSDDFCSVELESPLVESPGEPQPRQINAEMERNDRARAEEDFFIKRYNQVVVAFSILKRNHSLDEMTKRFALKSPLILRALIKAKLVAHRVKGLSACSLASLVAKPLECRAIGEKSPPNSH